MNVFFIPSAFVFSGYMTPSSSAVRPTTPTTRLSVPKGLDAGSTALGDLHHGRQIQVSGSFPDPCTSSLALKACALRACDNEQYGNLGREIHAFILKSSAEVNLELHVGNALIAMYARCGRMDEASSFFLRLGDRDRNAGRERDEVSVLRILSACSCTGNLLLGMEAHAFVIRRGLAHNLEVGNSLTDMYANCCKEKQPGRVFGGMPEKDEISWTMVVAGCSQSDCHLNVIRRFKEAQADDIMVDHDDGKHSSCL
ncbi:hypothetical protein MLD38_033069 [Melastoma candidum]|uniref:Uncharacterized protein n=1 Tax=Melastoma candidum TaxID=119954 RepID=A0ACB9M5Z6_9MYRT|nr:hypothetical protein MLD38_033069 [Melastoma candidum]